MNKVYVVDALRTAIGKFGGSLASTAASDLGAAVIKALVSKHNLPANSVDEVILGHVLTAGCGQNPARQATIKGGLADTTPAVTINKVCGSGMKALHLGAQAIKCGDADVIIVGGQENMSLAPHLLSGSRQGFKMGAVEMQDAMILDGLWDAFNDIHMGITAENLANQYSITRDEQDEYALCSQQRAASAQADGRFENEIVPFEVVQRKSTTIFEQDEFIRSDIEKGALAKLRPAFAADGTVTAGNASGLNDGAAAILLMSEAAVKKYGVEPMASIKAYASAGVDPNIMGIGPVPATRLCLHKAGWTVDDLELVEANEAFAAQTIAVAKEIGWNKDIVNVNGGAIALGHPIGASGARIIVTLLHAMQQRDVKKGLATLCIGGGQGVATAFDRV